MIFLLLVKNLFINVCLMPNFPVSTGSYMQITKKMKRTRRQYASIALALLLTLATVLGPWSVAMATPSDVVDMAQQMSIHTDSGDQHERHAGMSMDSMSGEDCCELGECNDCEQECSSCTMTSALVINPAVAQCHSPASHYLPATNELFSNIPPPPNKPPV